MQYNRLLLKLKMLLKVLEHVSLLFIHSFIHDLKNPAITSEIRL